MGLVTIINNGTDLGLHPSAIILARRRAKRAEAVSSEIGRRIDVRQRKGEMMYQHPRWLRGFDVSQLTADQGSADRSKHRIRLQLSPWL
jgi:hypothetical protein